MLAICQICGRPVERKRITRRGTTCGRCNVARWKANNPERLRVLRDRYYAANRGEIIARATAWNNAHPSRRAAIAKADSHNRRVKTKYQCPPIQKWMLYGLLAESKGRCFYCGELYGDNYHFDHYVPLSKGGKHELSNLRVACAPCNRHKAAKMPEDFKIVLSKSSLIDSKTRWGNEAEGASHRERLSEKTPQGDAIVRSCDIDETQEVGRNDQPARKGGNRLDYGNVVGSGIDAIYGVRRADFAPESGTAVNQSSLRIVNTLVG